MSAEIKSLSSKTKIDILIPAIEKDLETLPYVIDAVRKQVKHPIGQIIIVAPKRSRIMELCRRKQCKFVDENSVLPITKKNIHYHSAKWERSGWLFQQLLKMSGDTLCTSEYFLVIDADTVLIRPHVFTAGEKTIFYCRNWSQPEYFKAYRRLLGKEAASRASFVTHYMLFNKTKLAQLKRVIASNHQTSWYSAILRKLDKSKQFGFSEFETYGNFLYSSNPSGVIVRKALNKSLHEDIGQITQKRVKALSKKFRSISFHKRKGYVRKTSVKSQ
jgi:glycosyltransferase involved in cell wall biosynthesis